MLSSSARHEVTVKSATYDFASSLDDFWRVEEESDRADVGSKDAIPSNSGYYSDARVISIGPAQENEKEKYGQGHCCCCDDEVLVGEVHVVSGREKGYDPSFKALGGKIGAYIMSDGR